MIVYDMVMNVLEHNIAGLISGITFIVLFQSGETSTVEGNKHTHIQETNNVLPLFQNIFHSFKGC